MITIYEQLKRAKKGEVLYTTLPARNVTSAASRTSRKVTTERCVVYPVIHRGTNGSTAVPLLRVKVLS